MTEGSMPAPMTNEEIERAERAWHDVQSTIERHREHVDYCRKRLVAQHAAHAKTQEDFDGDDYERGTRQMGESLRIARTALVATEGTAAQVDVARLIAEVKRLRTENAKAKSSAHDYRTGNVL